MTARAIHYNARRDEIAIDGAIFRAAELAALAETGEGASFSIRRAGDNVLHFRRHTRPALVALSRRRAALLKAAAEAAPPARQALADALELVDALIARAALAGRADSEANLADARSTSTPPA